MKKTILGLAIVSAGLLSSCSDFLNEEPALKQSNELTFAEFNNLDMAGAALLGMLQSDAWYDGSYIIQSEMRCGNAKNPTSVPGSGRYLNETQWNFNESYTSSLWSYAYYTIARANNVINNLEGKEGGNVTAQQVNNLKAEALFARALCHFELAITYCQPYNYQADTLGVPIVLVTENAKPARNGKKAVYNQVVKDLTEAETL